MTTYNSNTLDVKHALLAPNKFLEKKVYGVPWYQERVVEKLKREEAAAARKSRLKLPISRKADSSRWVFIKDGLDDFRDGLPPIVPDIFIRRKDAFPMAKNDPEKQLKSLKQTAVKQRFTKKEICYSKTLPLVGRRRDVVNDVETGLLAHRLALFPHLMEAVPQEILEDVIGILDPEAAACIDTEEEEGVVRTKSSLTEDSEDLEHHSSDVLTPLSRFPSGKSGRLTSATSGESVYTPFSAGAEKVESSSPSIAASPTRPPSSKNPYRWMYNRSSVKANLSPRMDGSTTSRKAKSERTISPVVTADKFRANVESNGAGRSSSVIDGDGERHVTNVTKGFCDWVRGLGGEDTNNIEESTILSLFAAGYETKPSLLVPIKVVELQNIPNELRVAAGVPPPPPDTKKTTSVDPKSCKTISDVEALKEEERRIRSRANPDFGKFSFGAWYLPKKFWTKKDVEVPLDDPTDTHKQQESEIGRKNASIEEELALLSGSESFIDFLQKKQRKPEFMKRVGKIIDRNRREEEASNEGHQQHPAFTTTPT